MPQKKPETCRQGRGGNLCVTQQQMPPLVGPGHPGRGKGLHGGLRGGRKEHDSGSSVGKETHSSQQEGPPVTVWGRLLLLLLDIGHVTRVRVSAGEPWAWSGKALLSQCSV